MPWKRWQNPGANRSTALETRRAQAQERDQPQFCYRASLPAIIALEQDAIDDVFLGDHSTRRNGAPYYECAGQLRRAGRFAYTAQNTPDPG
jgi:hypothetical protein